MKLDLQENMYVRTKYGIKQIYKIDNNKTKWKYLFKLRKQDEDGSIDLGVLSNEDIIKASFNIIDLIEVGDILVDDTNRKLEVLLIDNELMVMNTGLIYDNNYYLSIKDIKIKSIVTHQQMEQISYKLGE